MKNEWCIVRKFEEEIAEFAGSKYGVAVESCTAALFLCCKYLRVKEVSLPRHTYPGVPCSVIHAGGKVKWITDTWQGVYQLEPYPIWDGAKRFRPAMYVKDSYYCLSFQTKKRIAIGRGGMILLNNKDAYDWFRVAIRDGKHEVPLHKDKFNVLGYNMFMTPEQAARGLQLFHANRNYEDLVEDPPYPDLSKFEVYNV